MTKAIFIILTLAGFASGAEMEVTDRLSVDGSMLVKSTLTVTGAGIEVRSGTSTAYSLAVGTSANYSFTVSTGGQIFQGAHQVLNDSMLDNFTLELDTTTNKIKVADRLEQNMMSNAFEAAVAGHLLKFGMVDGMMDEFADESGVDTFGSTNQAYDSTNDYYSPSQSLMTPNNMILKSNVTVAESTPTKTRIVLFEEDGDSIALNNDLKAYISRYTVPATDDQTKLLLHCDGTDGSALFQDETGKTVTAVAHAHISTGQSKFGGASGYFDGIDDYLTIPDSNDWYFGTLDFTVEFWARFSRLGSSYGDQQVLASQFGTYHAFYFSMFTDNTVYFDVGSSGSGWANLGLHTTALSTDTWYHFAGVRSGNTVALFLGGILQGSVAFSGAVYDSPDPLRFGTQSGTERYFKGYLDELRISKGVARWTTNFTPPAGPYEWSPVAPVYTQTTLSNEGNYQAGERILSGIADLSGQPSGTSMRWKVTTHNNRNLKLHGVGLNWD